MECTEIIKGQAVSMYIEECVKRVKLNKIRMEAASLKMQRVAMTLVKHNVAYGALKFEAMVTAANTRRTSDIR